MPNPIFKRCAQAGQSSVEYLVAMAVVVAIFTVPVDANGPLITSFFTAVGTGFSRFLAALSLPI
jgi:hypothetical protein